MPTNHRRQRSAGPSADVGSATPCVTDDDRDSPITHETRDVTSQSKRGWAVETAVSPESGDREKLLDQAKREPPVEHRHDSFRFWRPAGFRPCFLIAGWLPV